MAEKNEKLKAINELLTSGQMKELCKMISATENAVKNFKTKLLKKSEEFALQKAEQAKSDEQPIIQEIKNEKSVEEVVVKPDEKPDELQNQVQDADVSVKDKEKPVEKRVDDVPQQQDINKNSNEKPAVAEKDKEKGKDKDKKQVQISGQKAMPSFIVRRAEFVPDNKNNNKRKEFVPNNKQKNGLNRDSKQQRNDKGKTNGKKVQATYVAPAILPTENKRNFDKKVKTNEKQYEDKHSLSKRALIKNSISIEDFDENKTGYRKFRPVKKEKTVIDSTVKIEKAIITQEIIPLKVLSEKIGVTAAELTKRLFKEGIMKTINDSVDFDTAAYIADGLGVKLELKLEKSAEDVLSEDFDSVIDTDDNLVRRPPVVTVMGHVDHGKTSLLDRIRKTNITAGEAGGITQHIGAYQVTVGNNAITFLDTPGHAAFTAMRARGAQVTDIAVLVVAADDGIMPQTIEAINHAKAANVPIIVAVNKIDKAEANIEKVKTELTEHGLLPEEWGGDTIICPISAKTGEGFDKLLESINLVAEVKDLKANPNRKAKGAVIEAKLDNSKGPIATILIQNGTLKVGDSVVIGTVTGKIRAMSDDKGKRVKSAKPSDAVSVMGLDSVPNAGDILYAVEQDKLTKMVAEERKNKERENMIKAQQKVTLDDVFNKISEGELKGLNLIVKADVQGSVEAVKTSLEKLSNEEVKVNVIHFGVGAIKESDIMLAESSNAIIIGFNVRPDANAKSVAEHSGVDIKLYGVIYEAIEDVEKALKGMLAPKVTETYLGKAEVREVFKITGVGQVAGCYVVEGKVLRSGKLRIYRDDVMICEGNVLQLKRFKDDVKEVAQGFECGISIEHFNDIKIGDYIECYEIGEAKA